MPSITLDIQTAKLSSRFGSDYGVSQDGKWIWTSAVKMPWREALELGTGEKAEQIDMRLTFRETEDELVKWATEQTKNVKGDIATKTGVVTGTVGYHPEWSSSDGIGGGPATILFDVYAAPAVMASLIRFAENGRFIKQATIEVRGMEYGYAPDGSQKKWLNNSEQNMLPIINVTYELPLLEEPESDYSDDEERAKRAPQTPVGADLAPLLRELLKFQKWAMWLLAAIAGAVVVRGWQ